MRANYVKSLMAMIRSNAIKIHEILLRRIIRRCLNRTRSRWAQLKAKRDALASKKRMPATDRWQASNAPDQGAVSDSGNIPNITVFSKHDFDMLEIADFDPVECYKNLRDSFARIIGDIPCRMPVEYIRTAFDDAAEIHYINQ